MTSHHKHRKSGQAQRRPDGPRRANDLTVYVIIAMIGGFIALFSIPVLGSTDYWFAVLVGYAAVIAWLTLVYAWRVYRGTVIAGWQQALARVPLRMAGYGVRKGKPVEVAHDQPKARQVILGFGVISLVVIAVAGYFAIRPLLES